MANKHICPAEEVTGGGGGGGGGEGEGSWNSSRIELRPTQHKERGFVKVTLGYTKQERERERERERESKGKGRRGREKLNFRLTIFVQESRKPTEDFQAALGAWGDRGKSRQNGVKTVDRLDWTPSAKHREAAGDARRGRVHAVIVGGIIVVFISILVRSESAVLRWDIVVVINIVVGTAGHHAFVVGRRSCSVQFGRLERARVERRYTTRSRKLFPSCRRANLLNLEKNKQERNWARKV